MSYIVSDLWRDLPLSEQQRVKHAHQYSTQHLTAMRCPTAESCVQHCLEVALILREKIQNPSVVIAALLHALPAHPEGVHLLEEAPVKSWEELWMVSKLAPVCVGGDPLHWPSQATIEDPRLQLLFAAHVLDSVRHIRRWKSKMRQELCQRVFSEIVPLLREQRLNDWAMEMEETCFLETQPRVAKVLHSLTNASKMEDLALIDRMTGLLLGELNNAQEPNSVSYRIKTPYWVHRKMLKRQCAWNEVHDRLAIRILCSDEAACFRVLGTVHRLFCPARGSLKDYIAAPKTNGYRSLHTVVLGVAPTVQMVEIQIRSEDMHWTNEFGSASHTAYKTEKIVHVQSNRYEQYIDSFKSSRIVSASP